VEALLWTRLRGGPGGFVFSPARIAARGLLAEGVPVLPGAERDRSRPGLPCACFRPV